MERFATCPVSFCCFSTVIAELSSNAFAVIVPESCNSYTGKNGLPGGWKNCVQAAVKTLLFVVSS